MKLKLLLAWAPLFLLGACSFKSEDGSGVVGDSDPTTISALKIDPNAESDGDGLKDGEELALGRNPFVAELPDLKLQFMKDFHLTYEVGENLIQIDSLRDIRSRNFEYRVGDITLFDIAKKTTAHFARYDGLVVGDYKDVDLTRVSYPYVSPKFIALQSFNQRKGIYKNPKVVFTNTLKIDRNKGFQTIANPTLNFHYFNYETGEYDLIAQKKIEKSLFEGVLEKFEITLERLPQRLIEENFLQKGEFITAEIDDFEIPSMGMTYKKLMNSVLEKCIPVTVITPVGTRVYYVALNSSHNHLGQFLKSIYGDNFTIANNELVQVDGLTNNLPKFKLLSELANQTKNGKWFILINDRINDDIFQYVFKTGDKIVLNYMTGDELSSQSYKQSITTLPDLISQKNIQDFEIGEVGQNDELQIVLRSKDLTVDYTISSNSGFNDSFGNSSWIFQSVQKRNEKYSFTEESIQKRLAFVLNGKEYQLLNLFREKLVAVTFDENTLKISIPSVAKAFSLDSDEAFSLTLRAYPDNHQEDVGVWLTGIGGFVAGQAGCNSADAVCKSWHSGIPVASVCSHLQQPPLTNACTGVLKDEYRRKSQTLQRDLHFDASFLLINKYN